MPTPGYRTGIKIIRRSAQDKESQMIPTFTKVLPSESEFNESEPSLKSTKNRFQLSAGLNLETLNIILGGTNHI